MFRFVLAPDRRIVADAAATLPGRGIWLSARGDVLETARAQNGAVLAKAFGRAVRGPVILPPDLFVVLQAALDRRVMEFLGLARRAGQAVSGFQKAREWLVAGRAGLVIQAADGSPEERARFLGGYARRDEGAGDHATGDAVDGEKPGAPVVLAPLSAARLGQIFGRERAVHVAIARGRLADALAVECARLAALNGADSPVLGVGVGVGEDADVVGADEAGTNDTAPTGQDHAGEDVPARNDGAPAHGMPDDAAPDDGAGMTAAPDGDAGTEAAPHGGAVTEVAPHGGAGTDRVKAVSADTALTRSMKRAGA